MTHPIRTAACLALVSATVAACGVSSTAGEDKKAPAVQATAKASSEGAFVQALPQLKAGLWRTTSTTNGVADEPEEVCIGVDEPGEAQLAMLQDANCSKREFRQIGGGYSIAATCKSEGLSTALTGTYSGDFQKAVKADLTLTIATPDGKSETMHHVMTSRLVGNCTPSDEH